MTLKYSLAIVLLLLLLGIGALYMKDSATVEQALVVEQFLKDHCHQNQRYPDMDVLISHFPHLYPDQEWYYWPNEAMTRGSFQYPMTLPLPSAPGALKFSEFFPVIYAYSVRDPCAGLL